MNSTDSPAILYLDIETTIAIFAGFHLGQQYVTHEQILKRPQVMCISWAWNDEKVRHDVFDLKKYNLLAKDDDADFQLLERFSKEIAKADLLVGQNSYFFDLPTLLSRIIKYKLPPIPEILHDDTYLQTKKRVKHISHKLDDVGDYLGYGGKAPHGSGMDWWIRIVQGDKSILAKMVKYCDEDVRKLRKIYKHQLPYVKSKLNLAAFRNEGVRCPSPTCGSTNLAKNGFRRTNGGKFQRYVCNTCGKSDISDGTNLLKQPSKIVR